MISDAINRVIVRAYVSLKREEGQTFVEYSLIGVLIAVALAAALTTFKGEIDGALTAIGAKL
jgi:Flp pilus assembly pilin Flp